MVFLFSDLGSPNKMPEEEEAGKMGGGVPSAGFEADWSFGSLRYSTKI